jgi:hypothetical protein
LQNPTNLSLLVYFNPPYFFSFNFGLLTFNYFTLTKFYFILPNRVLTKCRNFSLDIAWTSYQGNKKKTMWSDQIKKKKMSDKKNKFFPDYVNQFSIGLFLRFSFIFFSNECYRWVSMGNLYLNLLNVNHAIYAKILIKKYV